MIIAAFDHEKSRQMMSEKYQNLRRYKLSDSELLMELIPYAEGLFCPSEEEYQPLVILPELSLKGNDKPLCFGVFVNSQNTFAAAIGMSMRKFGTDRAALLTEAWDLPIGVEKPRGMAIKDHPMRVELYALHLFHRRNEGADVRWMIERKGNVRSLGEPDVLIGRKSRWDQVVQDAWEASVEVNGS